MLLQDNCRTYGGLEAVSLTGLQDLSEGAHGGPSAFPVVGHFGEIPLNPNGRIQLGNQIPFS